MRVPKLVVLALLLLLSTLFSTTASSSSIQPNEEILALQNQLLQRSSTHSDIQSKLDQAVQQQADLLRARFRETPRPADREDDEKGREPTFGTSLWFLKEIPQWWVTAEVVKDLGDNRLLVHMTSTGEEVEATRPDQVRVVLESDRVAWNSEYLRDLGELGRVHNDQEERVKFYKQAIEADPTNPHPMDNLGLYYMDQEDYQAAEEWLEKSIEVEPNWYHSYYNLALIYRDHPVPHQYPEDSYRAALKLFETAFALNPLFLDGLWNVAELHSRLKNYSQECYHWRLLQALNQNPSPDHRDFGAWNPGWEGFTAQRIQECMALMKDHEHKDTKQEL